MELNNNKKVLLLGVSGGIAAYKSLEILRGFIKHDLDVYVIMTENAIKFVAPLSFSTLSGHAVITDLFREEGKIDHIELAKKASLFLCAPATANLLGKLAYGIADNALTTIALACTCPKIIAPAMNNNMWNNQAVKQNIGSLIKFGYEIISPKEGELACGDKGLGRMEEPEKIVSYCLDFFSSLESLAGKTVLITAGRTEEMIDPIRYISNHSSGKMGFALARQAKLMGAKVILICGKTSLQPPKADNCFYVQSAEEMYKAVFEHYESADIIIKAAAVSDYKPEKIFKEKIKKTQEKLILTLTKNPDILAELGKKKRSNQYLAGFAAETENLIEGANRKLKEKNLDLIIANDVSKKETGFESDYNQITLIDKNGEQKAYPILPKEKIAKEILIKIVNDLQRK